MMLDEALARRIDNPSLGPALDTASSGGIGDKVIEVVKRLVEFNGLDQ